MTTTGEFIAGLRRQMKVGGRRMTQAQLAAALDVSPRTVGAWEADERTPDGDNLISLAKFFGIDPDEILSPDGRGPTGPRGPRVVPIEPESGAPVLDEIEQLREWIPDEMARRMSKSVTPRVWLGMLYALGSEENWSGEILERIHAARKRLDDASEQGGEEGRSGS